MRRLALLLSFVCLLTACAHPPYGLDSCLTSPPPPVEETALSLRYRVRSDAGKSAAQEVSRFMDRAAGLWTPLFGVPDPRALPLEVQLYREPADVKKLLVSQRLTVHATGLYLPTAPPAIHVACRGEEPDHPYRTLLHEGTHQFAHLAAGYRPLPVAGKPAPVPRLAIPLWLSEGLATHFEAAFLNAELLVPGTPDPDRWSELRVALRKGGAPSLKQILTARYGDEFTSLDYAAAWGVVYVLMQEAPPPWAAGGREWLTGVLAEARRGWPGASAAESATDNYDPWWGVVTVAVHDAFLGFVAERGLTLPEWESAWRKWLLTPP
jgi:hypothetical protein